MPESEVNIAELFNAVSEALNREKDALNAADAYNHNHGDNMAQNFKVIGEALKQKQGASPSEQLAYASQVLQQSSNSGSAKLYSEGLIRASTRLQGQTAVTRDNAFSLVQALLGGGQVNESASGDLMGQLAGMLSGGGAAPAASQLEESQSPDVLGGLVGALLGGGLSKGSAARRIPQGRGITFSTLLTAGSTYLQAKEQGSSAVQAIIQAVIAGSQMKETPHQAQSGQVVGSTLLETISELLGGKKEKPKPKPKAKPKPKPKPKSAAKPKAKSKPKTAAKPKAKSKPKPKSAAKPKPKAKSTTKPKAKSKPKTKTTE